VKQETIAGVTLQQTYKPSIAASEYPVLDTKPLSSVVSSSNAHPDKLRLILLKEQDLVGLEDVPDFWNMTIDSPPAKKEDKTAGTFDPNLHQVLDITQKSSKSPSREATKGLDCDRVSLEAKPLSNRTYE
jgi:hypothetical protein